MSFIETILLIIITALITQHFTRNAYSPAPKLRTSQGIQAEDRTNYTLANEELKASFRAQYPGGLYTRRTLWTSRRSHTPVVEYIPLL